ncbi:universal stress protein [Streptomyces sp. RY43-2]|uniref:Universal stress protein n=1 Tax=Streptomyces macrolidinus TaxID=2952607 RepID=A0ABT0ZBN7_9ACTN|nr:universal stress protein [Streptomyces macrolidinus]MCN9241191.1 universal stress protein [Streptomyces macrolidinus]
MPPPLLVGVDGSESSLRAVDWATDEAARHAVPLRLVHASLWERYEHFIPSGAPQRPPRQTMAEYIVATAEERVRRRDPDVKVTAEILADDPVHALLHEGREAMAVVTGSRGRGELKGLLLGSVGLAVAGRAAGPVIVVRGDRAGRESTHGRIVLGAGEPGTSDTAARFALREAETRHCPLDVVRAWRRPAHQPRAHPLLTGDLALYLEERAATVIDALLQDALVDHPDVRVNRATAEGVPGKVLLSRSAAADLLVIGVRARRTPDHGELHLGRTAHTLLHHAECPVAVVPDYQE